jgi:hypothetical protein
LHTIWRKHGSDPIEPLLDLYLHNQFSKAISNLKSRFLCGAGHQQIKLFVITFLTDLFLGVDFCLSSGFEHALQAERMHLWLSLQRFKCWFFQRG